MPQEYENYAGIIGRICACNDVIISFLILESCVRTCKQRVVGRKMASISSSECESVPEPEIESSQSTSIPETSSEASSSTASSLLDRLRSPRPSDLAHKRQVKCNPPRGSRRGKGKVPADPSPSVRRILERISP